MRRRPRIPTYSWLLVITTLTGSQLLSFTPPVFSSDSSNESSMMTDSSLSSERDEFRTTTTDSLTSSGASPAPAPMIDCKCGVSSQNGDKTKNDFPWTAAIFHRSNFRNLLPINPPNLIMYCGGTLINDRYVITASRCVNGINHTELEVWLAGDSIWSERHNPKSSMHKSNISQIITHPGFDRRILNHEISILKLSTPVKLFTQGRMSTNESIAQVNRFIPACLPLPVWNSNSNYVGINGTLTSWDKKGRTSYTMLKTQVSLMSNTEQCRSALKSPEKVNDNMLCAGDVGKGAPESCENDTGSPLVIEDATNDGRKTVVGLVSWLYGCTSPAELNILYNIIFADDTAKPQVPGVYTRVEKYYQWIMENTLDGQWCSG